ncbi:hypothetical protein BEN71_14915 [Acinetobacter wuhouensis]|uniref:hypothetical protein n=1 Tax=Acinetobacter wuhouensis TaxID=1879050 RepID=UPI00083A2628|nr:hypothetical protein [Acinetobacter wuhouensis]AXQ23282.1 hypothetical protein BEN71_14915 [Acinetobacter wuhouensis]
MTTLNYTVKFHKTVLASFIGLCISQSCFALQELTDEKLGDTTGEGIALLPQNAYMVFQGVGANQTEANILDATKRNQDIGYIHYIPVGPLTSVVQDTNKDLSVTATDHSVGKADLYLYGLAVSKNANNDANSRLDAGLTNNVANAAIKSWGTAANPWILNVKTDNNVPDFGAGSGSVTYLNFEAPLYENIYSFDKSNNALTTKAVDSMGKDAYNLKLGLWADAFVLDQSKSEGSADQFKLGELFSTTAEDRANRIRLQGVWNGFGINGSKIQMFQTLGGADNANGMSKFYNNTLGMAGVLRFNSGDGSKLLATGITNGSVTKTQSTTNRYSTVFLGQPNTSTANHISQSVASQYRLRTLDTAYDYTTGNWTAPANLNDHVLRLSTQETTDTANLATPALNNTLAPTFNANEGIYIYNLNTNLVLGSVYQPLILGSDGKNFSLELTRIPNKAAIYEKIYTDYSNPTSSTYLGSTCNVYKCGRTDVDVENVIAGYQRSNATHSSISIGTVYSPDGGNTLLADKTAGAVGISFGALSSVVAGVKSQQIYYQLQMQQRRAVNNAWQYLQADGVTWGNAVTNGCSGAASGGGSGACYNPFNTNAAWVNIPSFNVACLSDTKLNCTASGSANTLANTQIKDASGNLVDLGYAPNVVHNGYVVGKGWGKMGWSSCAGDSGYCSNINIESGQWAVPTWGGGAKGSTLAQSVLNAYGANYTGTTWTSTADPTSGVPLGTTTLTSPMNNLGSAVIDGVLIQHLKLTTKGL